MRYKQYLAAWLQRTLLLFRALHVAAVVPVVFMDIVLPVLLLLIFFRQGSGGHFPILARQLYGVFMPFMSCWWVVFVQKFFSEDNGCELLTANRKKSRLLDLAVFYVLGILCALISALPVVFIDRSFFFYWCRLLAVSIFIFGEIYFVSVVFGSTMPTIFSTVIYVLINLFSPCSTVRFPLYYSPESEPDLLFCELPLAAFGIALIVTAEVLARKGRVKL